MAKMVQTSLTAMVSGKAAEGGKRKADEIAKPANGNGKTAEKSKKKEEEEEEDDDDDEDEDDEDHNGEDDGEGDDDEEGDDDDDDDEDDEDDEKPQKKKRRTADDDGDDEDAESDPEVKLNEDDFIGIDTSNIIPRARRRAAVAAMSKPMEDLPPKAGVAAAGDEDEDESDEAEF